MFRFSLSSPNRRKIQIGMYNLSLIWSGGTYSGSGTVELAIKDSKDLFCIPRGMESFFDDTVLGWQEEYEVKEIAQKLCEIQGIEYTIYIADRIEDIFASVREG